MGDRGSDGLEMIQEQLEYLIWSFMRFETILSMKISLEKIELIPIRGVDNVEALGSHGDVGCGTYSLHIWVY